MQVWHQKPFFSSDLPLSIFTTDDTEFPPHWHEAVEIVYSLGEGLKVGVNNEVYTLDTRDILLISGGDVHYFPPQPVKVKRVILFFEIAFFEDFTKVMKDKRFTSLIQLIPTALKEINNPNCSNSLHQTLEYYILEIMAEYSTLGLGYKLALRARLSDILVLLLRQVPIQVYSPYEKNRQLNRLERLEKVFNYVENNFDKNIPLEEIAHIANYSTYHFTRFFKEATGMTFSQYVNNYRITKAAEALIFSNDPIIDIAYKAGFSSIKTFNRVFKNIKGSSPSHFKKAISEN